MTRRWFKDSLISGPYAYSLVKILHVFVCFKMLKFLTQSLYNESLPESIPETTRIECLEIKPQNGNQIHSITPQPCSHWTQSMQNECTYFQGSKACHGGHDAKYLLT